MSFSYLFDPNKQFQDRNGVNNVGGFLRVYIDGTDDRATTYKDFNGTLNEADIMLDTDGRAVVIVDDSFTFRIEVYERDGALQWTVMQFTARGEGGGGGSSTPVVVDGTANEIDVTERMTAGVKYYTIGLATVVKNTLLGLLASFSNLVGILNSKTDKVQGATAGNLAALDASGNLTDSGSKAADFKTKQTPVADPIASGAGLEFIDSVTQDANGEITPHKKAVQDGTTAQKGVVKLSNAIDSTSVTEAATPKAVKDAYDELNNKIVARAVFLSQAEWAVQSQLEGDPAKVYYVENGTGEDAYTVYVWKESTSTYEEVDESSIDLDGYWHDSPTTTGSGNVVTNITLGNDGVPQVEKGMSAEPAFSVLPINKGGTGKTTGKAATNNLFSDINNVNTDPDDTARIVFKYGSPSDSNGIFFARAITNLWNYIQNKISSVLGLTASSYGGNAATAGAADTASAAASGSALESAINNKLDKNGYVGYKEGFWVGVKWPINTTYASCFWKVCSFSVSNYWSLSFELIATNLLFDSIGQETKVITICSNRTDFVEKAVEYRTKYAKIDERGYGNIMYYTLDSGVVTIYVKTAKNVNVTQFLRLVSVTDCSSITNLTWYCEAAPGEQPSSPTKFTEQIVNVTPSVGSQTTPVYSDAYGKLQQCDTSSMSVGSATTASDYASGGGIDSALGNKLDKTGDASNTTSTFTKASGDTSTMTSGSKLSAIFTAISSFFASLKALAFKDKASYNDLSSGVQSSLDKADSALQSHQSVTDNNPTLTWGTTSKVGTVGSTDLRVTMPANPAQNLPASVITSGTFGTDRIADDAITADKVKDNETLPVNISGNASTATHLSAYGSCDTWQGGSYNSATPFALIAETTYPIPGHQGEASLLQFELANNEFIKLKLNFTTNNGSVQNDKVIFLEGTSNIAFVKDRIRITYFTYTSNNTPYVAIRAYVKFTADWQYWRIRQLDCQTGDAGFTNWRPWKFFSTRGSNIDAPIGTLAAYTFRTPFTTSAVGDSTTPVYVDSNGQVQPCDPSQMSVGNATKWDGHAIRIGSVSSSAGTISIV